MHSVLTWALTIMEVLYFFQIHLNSYYASTTASIPIPSLCLSNTPNIRVSTLSLIGCLTVIIGSLIRLDCFKTLGPLFTFDLTIQADHHLIRHRLYSIVRHPSYTGSMLLVIGLALTHLTAGSWLTECGPLLLLPPGSSGILWSIWWVWTLSVGCNRAQAEDLAMRELFGEQWLVYASDVGCWFLPGVL